VEVMGGPGKPSAVVVEPHQTPKRPPDTLKQFRHPAIKPVPSVSSTAPQARREWKVQASLHQIRPVGRLQYACTDQLTRSHKRELIQVAAAAHKKTSSNKGVHLHVTIAAQLRCSILNTVVNWATLLERVLSWE